MPGQQRRFVARFGEGTKRLTIEDAETLKVLYDPVRFKIVGLLRDGQTAKELAEELGRPLTSLYYHLNLLVEHGLAEVTEERVRGRTVERVFRRAADEFVAQGEFGALADGLIDRDARLASMVGHLRQVQHPADPNAVSMIQDLTFQVSDNQLRDLVEAIRETVRGNVPKRTGKSPKPGERRVRLLIALGEVEDEPG